MVCESDAGSFLRLLSMGATLWLSGCHRPTDLTYVVREEVKELPDRHQKELEKVLRQSFGTPADPLMSMTIGAADPSAPRQTIPPEELEQRSRLKHGQRVYEKQCQACHGVSGDGNGPAAKYLNPLPRDYRLGRFKFTSTPRGIKPLRDDLRRIIHRGAKGTSMPAFRWLPDDELEAVIDYVILLSSRGESELALVRLAGELSEDEGLELERVELALSRVKRSWERAASERVLPQTAMPLMNDETIREGATAFIELNCFKCHGKDGQGNRAFNVGKDDWGHTAFAADLTSGTLHGGRRPVDVYRRIYSGINGTPMPSYKDPDSTKEETAEQRSDRIWRLVHFVTAIVEGRELPLDAIEKAIKHLPTEAQAASGGSATNQPINESAEEDCLLQSNPE